MGLSKRLGSEISLAADLGYGSMICSVAEKGTKGHRSDTMQVLGSGPLSLSQKYVLVIYDGWLVYSAGDRAGTKF